MLIGGSFSYLYFNKQGENTNVVKSGCLKISLSESSGLKLENEVPVIDKVGREKSPYTVTLTNTCNTDAYFKTTLNVLDSSNRDNISKTKLAVSGDRTINSLLVSELMKAKLSETPSNVVDTYLIDRGYLLVGESKTYDIKLWIDYEATSYDGSLETKIIVDTYVKGQEPIYLKSNLANSWKEKTDNELNYLALFTLGSNELPSTYTYNNEEYTLTNTVDVSEQGNGEVLLGEYTNSDKIIALIGQEEGVIAPSDSSALFNYLKKSLLVDVKNLDTSNVENAYAMFANLENAKEIRLYALKTDNFINMQDIFCVARNLLSIDLSNFNTNKVENMRGMFFEANKITNIKFGDSYDTSNVVNMAYAFYNCNLLENIDVSSFDTSNITNMGYMFTKCTNLKTLDLKNWNTSKVTNMGYMFQYCSNISKITVGCNFIINEKTNITDMFANSKISEVTKICNE